MSVEMVIAVVAIATALLGVIVAMFGGIISFAVLAWQIGKWQAKSELRSKGLKDHLSEINDHLEKINGRVGDNENDIAEHRLEHAKEN